MKVVEQFAGAFLRLVLENDEERSRFEEAYQHACYSGMQVQKTVSAPHEGGSRVVGLWLDERLVEPFQSAIKSGECLRDSLVKMQAAS